MNEVKWIKLDIRIFDNRKIKAIRTLPEGDSLVVIWLQLMCLAGSVNDGGRIYLTEEVPYTDQMLANAFGEPLATIQLALTTFRKFGMIEIVDDILRIANWEKYQAIEELERIREQNRNRVRNFREKQKLLGCNVTCNADVTQCNGTDIDIERDIDSLTVITNKKENMGDILYPAPHGETIYELFEIEFGRPLGQLEFDHINQLVTEYGEYEVTEALRDASIEKKVGFKYIEAILKRKEREKQ